jgi:hypothetical protein
MYWELYQILILLAAGCTTGVLLFRQSIVPLGLLGSGVWSILMYQARNITIYHSDGTSTVVGSPSWQFVCLGAALLLLTAVTLHFLNVFPPQDSASNEGAVGAEQPAKSTPE